MDECKLTRPYFIAQALLSILPGVGENRQVAAALKAEKTPFLDEEVGLVPLFYPVVGFVIGLGIWLAAVLLSSFTPLLLAVIVTTVWLVLTGSRHLRDLAAVADGLLTPSDKQGKPVIANGTLGIYGMIAVILMLMLKVGSIDILLVNHSAGALIFIPVLARAAVLALLAYTPLSNDPLTTDNSMLLKMKQLLNIEYTQAILLITVVIVFLKLGLLVLLVTIAAVALIRYLTIQRCGGMTPAVMSLSIELFEVIALLVMAFNLV